MTWLSVPSGGRVQMGRCGQGSFPPCTAGGPSSATVSPWPPSVPSLLSPSSFSLRESSFLWGGSFCWVFLWSSRAWATPASLSSLSLLVDSMLYSIYLSVNWSWEICSQFHWLFLRVICWDFVQWGVSLAGSGESCFWWLLDSLALGTVRALFSPLPPHPLPQHSCWFCVCTEECYTWCDPTYCSLGFVEIPFHLVLLKILSVLLLLPLKLLCAFLWGNLVRFFKLPATTILPWLKATSVNLFLGCTEQLVILNNSFYWTILVKAPRTSVCHLQLSIPCSPYTDLKFHTSKTEFFPSCSSCIFPMSLNNFVL